MGETFAVVVGAEEMQMVLEAPEVIIRSETMEDASVTNNENDQNAVGELLQELVEEVSSLPKKKFKDDDAMMDVDDLLSMENKENLVQGLKRMSRKELEDLVLVKMVEALIKHSEAGKFRTKMLEMQISKDKMQQRVTHLQKQVVEMGKAVKLLLENHNRDPNNLNQNKKRPPPIKFYRSVGLQVTIEPTFRNGPTKVVHVSGNPINGVKPLNSTQNIPSSNSTPINKRPGPKSLTQPKPLNGLPQTVSKGLTQMNGHLSSSPNRSPTKPTVVDLTDDVATIDGQANPVQYRLINTNGQGVQLVQTVNGQQGRTMILAQQNNNTTMTPSSGRPMQAIVMRNVAPRPTGQQRPYTRTPNQTVATIPNRSPAAVVKMQQPLGSSNNKKIQLPQFPNSAVVNVPRGRVLKELPPKPSLTLNEQTDGIVLSWTMKLTLQNSEIASYQIYASQESLLTSPGKISSWKKVGDVKALPLPMACTLSQFTPGNRYFFIVRAMDSHGRSGPFCEPGPIVLQKK